MATKEQIKEALDVLYFGREPDPTTDLSDRLVGLMLDAAEKVRECPTLDETKACVRDLVGMHSHHDHLLVEYLYTYFSKYIKRTI